MPRRQDLGDQTSAVLLVHVRRCVAVHCDDIIGGSRVQVHREHRAGAQVEHGHWKVC